MAHETTYEVCIVMKKGKPHLGYVSRKFFLEKNGVYYRGRKDGNRKRLAKILGVPLLK
jgi:hypothetical protein